jgi:hypothetical protein
MTAGPPPAGDQGDIEALTTDGYLEALLTSGDAPAQDARVDVPLDPETRLAIAALRRALVRVHPSFRFEERLAARLATMAAASSEATGVVVPFPARPAATSRGDDDLLPAILSGRLDPADDRVLDFDSRVAAVRRPLLVGGAITSAAISLVGVAWVAWRATRQPEVVDIEPVSAALGGLG